MTVGPMSLARWGLYLQLECQMWCHRLGTFTHPLVPGMRPAMWRTPLSPPPSVRPTRSRLPSAGDAGSARLLSCLRGLSAVPPGVIIGCAGLSFASPFHGTSPWTGTWMTSLHLMSEL